MHLALFAMLMILRMRDVMMSYRLGSIMAASSLKILEKVPLKTIFHAGFIVSTGTILLCYTLATTLGHVPDWLPMISDCAVYAPEKYPFRWGIMLGAVLIAVQSVLVYGADKPYSKSKTALNLALFASFCLSVVAVVNEVEDIKIHGGEFTAQGQLYWVEGCVHKRLIVKCPGIAIDYKVSWDRLLGVLGQLCI